MRRLATGLVALAGCGFQGPALVGDGGVDAKTPHSDAASAAMSDSAPMPFCDPTNADLVACYTFEGVATDGSQYGNNPTTTTAATYVAGHDGLALQSTAATDIRIKDSVSLDVTTAITIELWLRPNAIADVWIIDNDNQYGLHMTGAGALDCSIAGLGSADGGAILSNVWTHLACTYDGSANRAWVNGVQVGMLPIMGPMQTSSTTGMAIGHDSPTGPKLDGLIDSVRIWRIARMPAQIACVALGTC